MQRSKHREGGRKSLLHAPVNVVIVTAISSAFESDGGDDVSDGDAEIRSGSVVWACSEPGSTSPDPPFGRFNRRFPFRR